MSLWDLYGVPPTRVPIGATTLVSYVLPPLVCYFVAAVLAVTPQTRAARVALWPVICFLALRAVVSVDMSLGKPEQKLFNTSLVASIFRHKPLQASDSHGFPSSSTCSVSLAVHSTGCWQKSPLYGTSVLQTVLHRPSWMSLTSP